MPAAVKSRARPTNHPELDDRRGALSVLSNGPLWKRWPAELRYHCSYVVVPGAIPGSDCHHWIGVRSTEGYGRFTAEGWEGQAHHYALERIAGLGSCDGRRVYRRCSDTACVNPDHLTVDGAPAEWGDPLTAPELDGRTIPRRAAGRFWAKVDRDREGTCWGWTGTVGPQGYGRFTVRRGWATGAHRMAYALAHGSIPKGLHVCHGPECQERDGADRLCVNPAHLIADTHAANMSDMKGGHFRRPLSKIPISPATRAAAIVFLPVALSVLKEQGDLEEGASLGELHALHPVGGSSGARPNRHRSPLQPT